MKSTGMTHRGLVSGVSDDSIYVKLAGRDTGRDCGSCALAASCGGSGKDDVTVRVRLAKGYRRQPTVGEEVIVTAHPRLERQATFVLIVLPLVVFLSIAVVGSIMGLESGVAGMLAISGGALCYLGIYFVNRRRPAVWTMTDTTPYD